ncbi:ABC transporter permease [Martelella lutilitoris]|uniref:ABC transporter permease n=1 Tax=Martelella lutilitoris TaxID=2583532 RepID=A0A5C4JSN9_9HYPH|nr:ABC transporter permease [Martelella lutilitoris]TNB48388.1 ABC transporter permease [Martelella lutilitoris]
MNKRALMLLMPALVLSGIVFLLPFLWLFVTSFRVQGEGSLLMAEGFSAANYARLVSDTYFAEVFFRTIWMSAAATVLSLVIALPMARQIAVSAGRAKGLLLALILVPLVSGALLPTLGMLHLLGPLGVINSILKDLGLITRSVKFLGTVPGVIIGLVQAFLPLMLLPLVNALSRLPKDVEAAAETLGAPTFIVWRRVILPLIAPGIIAGSVLVFCASLTSFVTPQILGQGKIATFGTMAYQQASLVLDWPFASAIAVVMLAILALGLAIGSLASKLLARRPA